LCVSRGGTRCVSRNHHQPIVTLVRSGLSVRAGSYGDDLGRGAEVLVRVNVARRPWAVGRRGVEMTWANSGTVDGHEERRYGDVRAAVDEINIVVVRKSLYRASVAGRIACSLARTSVRKHVEEGVRGYELLQISDLADLGAHKLIRRRS